MGDPSIEYQITTEASVPYFVPAPLTTANVQERASEELSMQFLRPRTVKPPGRSITALRNVYVLPNAAIVTAEHNILAESCFPYSGPWVAHFFKPWLVERNGELEVNLAGSQTVRSPAVYVREHGESGFFHWMHSVFPRTDTFQHHLLGSAYKLLYRSDANFQSEGLSLAGLNHIPRIAPNFDAPQFYPQLLFPSALVEQGDFWLRPPTISAFYDALPLSNSAPHERIYLTREDAATRRIKNGPALEAKLAGLGFKALEISKFSFAEQLGIFRGCKIVVSAHGAGLSHIIVMAPGSVVVELLHPRRFWPTYRAIAARRGLHYGFIVGQDIAEETGDAFDFAIDLSELDEVLRQCEVG